MLISAKDKRNATLHLTILRWRSRNSC